MKKRYVYTLNLSDVFSINHYSSKLSQYDTGIIPNTLTLYNADGVLDNLLTVGTADEPGIMYNPDGTTYLDKFINEVKGGAPLPAQGNSSVFKI